MEDRRDNIGGDSRYYGPPPDLNLPPPPLPKMRRKQRRQPPQETVNTFWDRITPKHPGKVFTVLPNNPYARKKAAKTPHGAVSGQRAAKSYEEARLECAKDVNRIIKECRRINQKYRDLHFDIEWDLKSGQRNCLDGLSATGDSMKPKGVRRLTDIFEKPEFFINGPTAGDVRQGRDGDCYLMAALCGLGNMQGLIDKVCVKHDKDCQDVGVYGFVFFRDGEWQHTIIDDKLYTRAPDYDEAQDERVVWDDINRVDSAEEYRKAHLTGSRALYFAQCSDENETWLPLLEKAYAKAHGDFASIDGGFTGEAIEDLTGGVTTEIYSTDILDREAFWRDELMQVGKEFLFGCATGFYANWLDTSGAPREREGISEGHAYSIMDAKEINGQRLLKLRNPWGKKEWTGRWSDGSSEWTPEWMQLLGHTFGNDGIFYISYSDLLKKYQHFDRTRIFGPDWNVTQCWTSLNVPWSAQYHSTKFSLTLAEKTRVVIVLAQLDDVYFNGLEGGYGFDLQFRLESDAKEDENDYIVRSNGNYAMARSVSTDIELEAGVYSVLMKITATRNTDKEHLEDVLPVYAATRREKLIQMGLSYDLAHAKGVQVETAAERKERKASEKARRAKSRENAKRQAKSQAKKVWKREKKEHDLDKKRAARTNHWRERKNRANESIEEDEVIVRVARRQGTFDSMAGGLSRRQTEFIDDDNVVTNGDDNLPLEARDEFTAMPIRAGKPVEEVTVEKVVQPLEEIIKVASDEARQGSPEKIADDATKVDVARTEDPTIAPGQANNNPIVKDVKPLASLPPQSRPEHDITNDTKESIKDDSKLSQNTPATNGNLPRAPERSNTLNSTAALFGIGNGTDTPLEDGQGKESLNLTHANGGQPALDGPNANDKAGDVSDTDSFPPFDWDTELDFTGSQSSDSDSDSSTSTLSLPSRRHRPRFRPPPPAYIRRGGRRRSRSPPLGGLPPPLPPPREYIDIDDRRIGDDGDDGPDENWNAVCVLGLRVYSTLKGEGVKLRVVRPSGFSDEDDNDDDGKGKNTNGRKDPMNEMKLDPDDMSKGAVDVVPESTGAVVEGERDGQDEDRHERKTVEKDGEMKLGRRRC